jgi:hypothetical protein
MRHPIKIVNNKAMHKKRRRRFNVIDRAVQKARQEIMAQEDAAIFAILDGIAKGDKCDIR